MKFLLVFIGLLLTCALSSASYPCGQKACDYGQVCRTTSEGCSCVPINECHEITLSQKIIGTWTDESCGKTYTQYDITIKNNLTRDIRNIFIGTDHTLNLRDNQSIWNIVSLPNGVLTLPSYQSSINSGASFTFGYILEGTKPANLNVLAISY